MGNCVFKGNGGARKIYDKDDSLIKVVTPNGGVMELHPPIFAEFITNEFPGHVIHDSLSLRHSSPPLLHGEELAPVTAVANGSGSGGVWKVRLVITPEQLAEILAADLETEALVESVRMVAKVGGGYGGAHFRANSDQLSVTSSYKG
ncbi:hypothetical protein AALP_AA5G277600 [Arabis alpina]|uniref:Uncharacterized protein n=1 Tax=Arabis alpina TaxID=50452 RepID=A0A087GZS7_ARAAL|nr:hypothetical protein AALP_AA5G277600 [Arabis alpina]